MTSLRNKSKSFLGHCKPEAWLFKVTLHWTRSVPLELEFYPTCPISEQCRRLCSLESCPGLENMDFVKLLFASDSL